MQKQTYIVTDKAGPKVAGRVVKAGDPLELTDLEAAYERQLGTIKKAPSPAEAAAEPVTDEVASEPESEASPAEPDLSGRRSKRA